MAIPKSKRTTPPLSVLVEADTLACYTILICTDESRFPKRYRWCLTKQIIESAVQAKMHIAKANSVYVNDTESAKLRRTYQQEAIADIAALSAAMDTAFRLFSGLRHIDTADASLQCWAAHAGHGNNHIVISKMYTYYRNLWRDTDV